MAAVFPDEGLDKLCRILVNKDAQGDLKVHLYTDAVALATGDTLAGASRTECALAGYAVNTQPGAGWTFATVGHVVTGTGTAINYVFTAGGVTIRGYYITDNGTTKILYEEAFGTPYTVPAPGGSLTLTPTLSTELGT